MPKAIPNIELTLERFDAAADEEGGLTIRFPRHLSPMIHRMIERRDAGELTVLLKLEGYATTGRKSRQRTPNDEDPESPAPR